MAFNKVTSDILRPVTDGTCRCVKGTKSDVGIKIIIDKI